MHPLHIHLVDFQLLGRDAHDVSGFDPAVGGTRAPIRYAPGTRCCASCGRSTARTGVTGTGTQADP
ncbi:hypothetical protein [Streptomyces sp. WAC04114]|uniref:hypothetical protein n=1 Tax=Streptomyces sp. WAC04114 TaxID=2867961 RepID=UPI0035AB7F76